MKVSLSLSPKHAKTTVICLYCLLISSSQVMGQPQMLDEAALQQEGALQAKLTLEVTKKPLNEMLDLLQQQSGVKLSSAPDSPAKTVKVTARFNQMTLADALCALTRIYGVQWQKSEGAYIMHRYSKDDLHLRLFQRSGTPGNYTTDDVKKEQEENAAFVAQIYDSIAENSWKSPDGVAFKALPLDLQEQLRTHILAYNSLSAAKHIGYEEKAANDDLELRLGSVIPGSVKPHIPMFLPPLTSQFVDQKLKFRGPGWLIYSSKGELVIPIFPEMHGPSQAEKEDQAKILQMVK